jgi:hypothetical protein
LRSREMKMIFTSFHLHDSTSSMPAQNAMFGMKASAGPSIMASGFQLWKLMHQIVG